MTRAHYSARPGGTKAHGKAYRGVPAGKPTQPRELPLVAVEEELVECPGCHGGVKLVWAPGRHKVGAKVFPAHKYGGTPARGWVDRCPKSLEVPDGS